MTLRAFIHTTLRDDATLRSLLDKSSQPYGIYQNYPPADVDFPIVTHRAGYYGKGPVVRPKNIIIESWGAGRKESAERVYDLLHNATSQSIDDFHLLKIRFQQSAGDEFDQNFEKWFRKDIYKCLIIRE